MVIDALNPLIGQVKSATPSVRTANLSRNAFTDSLTRAQKESPRETPTPYTVRPGDTLSAIVARYRERVGQDASNKAVYDAVQRVAAANGLKNANLISANQAIDLTAATSADQPMAKANSSAEDLLISETLLQRALLNPARHRTEARSGDGPLPSPVTAKLAFAKPETPMDKSVTPAVAPTHNTNPWDALISKPASLTSDFGKRKDPITGKDEQHEGIDLAAKKGSAVFPYTEGEVVFSGWQRGYGNVVIIDHGGGIESVYGHNQKNLVKRGEHVGEKTKIASVGSTGYATGNHLHFEVRKDGHAVDPKPYLEDKSIQVALAF